MRKKENYNPKKFWEQRLSNQTLDICSVGYSGLGYTYNSWLYRTRFAALSRALFKTHLQIDGKSVLEGGVGSGIYLPFWQHHGARTIIGIDITEASVKALTIRYPQHSFFERDLTTDELDVPGAPFDIVTAQDVLFHIIDDDGFSRAIQNLSKLLRSNGYLIISDGFCNKPWGPVFHEYHRSRSHYERELNILGIRIIHIEPIFFTMLTPLCGSSLLQKVSKVEIRLIQKYNSIRWLKWVNNWIGFALSTTDRFLGNSLKDGPSLKILIAQKKLISITH